MAARAGRPRSRSLILPGTTGSPSTGVRACLLPARWKDDPPGTWESGRSCGSAIGSPARRPRPNTQLRHRPEVLGGGSRSLTCGPCLTQLLHLPHDPESHPHSAPS